MLQPTAFCNLDCTYCYVPDRHDKARLPMALLEKLLAALAASKLQPHENRLSVLWHAGEPLATGLAYYREALPFIRARAPAEWAIRHSIQTNGTLIDDAWCDFFAEHRVSLGVSLDGPAELNDAARKTRGGGGSFARVMRGIERLKANNIRVSLLCVLHAGNIGHPDVLYRFFRDSSVDQVAFNVEEVEGENAASSLGGAGAARAYRAFMTRLADRNSRDGWPLKVREFANLARLIQLRRATPGHAPEIPEQRLGEIITLARDGAISSFSPELASGARGDPGAFTLGNIADVDTLDALLDTPRARAFEREINRGVSRCKRDCAYFGVCGGGSPANKFYESGAFDATETLKCALQTKALTEVVLSAFAAQRADA